MGILDDAIREHLELKRRHGVAEEELQRQEEEALGPARRDVAQQHEETELAPGQQATAEPGEEPAAAAASEDTVLFDSEADAAGLPPAAEADAASGPADEPTPVEPPPVEPPPFESTAPDEADVAEHASVGELGHEPDPHDALGETQPHGFKAVEDAADEAEPYDRDPDDEDVPAVDDEDVSAGDDDEDEDPDLLEDTPDFLQETPEHDRLWFEQKPPRDFDFD
jgi:hypothetical protein